MSDLPRVPIRQHLANLDWKQGQHVIFSAPTEAGKTTLAKMVLAKRRHVVVLATKSYDDTLTNDYRDYERITKWPPPQWANRVLLWPKIPAKADLSDILEIQRPVIREALNRIANARGWCVAVDESHYTTDPGFLGLGKEIAIMHHQGRSSGISMVSLTQRPAWIPKIIYSSVSHAYIARTADKEDLSRLSAFGGLDAERLKDAVKTLTNKHDFVYVDTRAEGGSMCIVNARR